MLQLPSFLHNNSVEKKSIHAVLNNGPGSAMMIVIGGAAEALNARPHTHDLTLNNRKGFVKIALENGLVPYLPFFLFLLLNPATEQSGTGSCVFLW